MEIIEMKKNVYCKCHENDTYVMTPEDSVKMERCVCVCLRTVYVSPTDLALQRFGGNYHLSWLELAQVTFKEFDILW